jgi:hypothetical protein
LPGYAPGSPKPNAAFTAADADLIARGLSAVAAVDPASRDAIDDLCDRTGIAVPD